MFSPIGGPGNEEKEIDWISDLKFFIDNDDAMLSNYFFPAFKKHEEHIDDPKSYKIYFKPIQAALNSYCEKFNVQDKKEKFPNEALIALARQICDEQAKHIKNGDYENK